VKWGYPIAVALVVGGTLLMLPFRGLLGGAQWGWPYLLIVGLVASASGVGPALLAAGLSFLAQNLFFVPPYGSLAVRNPADLVQLVAFLLVAGVWGWQAGRLRERQLEARRDEAEAEALLALSARVASETSISSMTMFVGRELARLLGARRTIVWLCEAHEALPIAAGGADPDELAASRPYIDYVLAQAKAIGLPAKPASDADHLVSEPSWPASVTHAEASPSGDLDDLFLPLQTTARLEGVLQVGWRAGDRERLGPRALRLVVSGAQMIAAFLTNRRLITTEARAEAVADADRLKTAIVSSVSHELKTPLASITAAVTDLTSEDVTHSEADVRIRLASVIEDLGRLENSIGDLLDTSRLEAGQWRATADVWEAGEIVADVVSRLAATQRSRVVFDVPEPGPAVYVDFAQLSRALTNVLDNALLYGPTDEPVVIGARSSGSRTLVWVEDHGPGVSVADRDLVFDKFYRGDAGRARSGSTGLGLSIAREIVQANGGMLALESVSPTGARFVISLPAEGPAGSGIPEQRAIDPLEPPDRRGTR
jgi:two-component system sensor histidine kinase KdpD